MIPTQDPARPADRTSARRLSRMMHPYWLRLVAVLLVVLALRPGASATATTTVGPKTYYLALGDSLAWGYQPNGQVFQGYDMDLYEHLVGHGTWLEANLGCLGETTITFINGGCPDAYLHKYPYSGAQLSAALTFIRQHPGQVSPVTIDIGADDALPLINSSTCAAPSTTVVSQTLATFDSNFSSILAQLRTALQGTGDLVTMNYYFPYQNTCPSLLPDVETFNQHLAAEAQQNGVPVADVFGAFGGATVPNPTLCTYTWICSSYHDVHATSQGYAVIAQQVESMLGY
jgi:lysophospholipase L1-like esterase